MAALALQIRADKVARVVIGRTAMGEEHAEAQYLENGQWFPAGLGDIDGVYATGTTESSIALVTHIIEPSSLDVIGMLAKPVTAEMTP